MSRTVHSIARQVSLTGAAAVAVALLGVSLVVGTLLKRSANDQVQTWVGDKAATLVDAMQAMDEVAAQQVRRSFGSFRQEFGPSFTLDKRRASCVIGAPSSTATSRRSTSSPTCRVL